MVQMTFEKVLKYLPNYSGKGSFKSWLFSIARNLHIDYYRKNNKMKITDLEAVKPINASVDPQKDTIQDQRMRMLEKAINSLDPDKKELLVLTKLKGLKYKDVADIYDVNEGTIKVRVCRIMKELKSVTMQYASSQQ
jgi:RNA polymerase sigma-70 factor (ECF subfamily)